MPILHVLFHLAKSLNHDHIALHLYACTTPSRLNPDIVKEVAIMHLLADHPNMVQLHQVLQDAR